MPFCPLCHYEYKSEVQICPDCRVDLVPELIVKDDSEYRDWIPLARIMSQQVAEMVLEALREKDIPAVIESGTGYFGTAGAMGPTLYAPIGGGYTIMVPAEYAAEADGEGETILGDDWQKARLTDIDSSEERST